jgi:hypothetical protein
MKIALRLRDVIATTRLSRPFATPTREQEGRVRAIMCEVGVL